MQTIDKINLHVLQREAAATPESTEKARGLLGIG